MTKKPYTTIVVGTDGSSLATPTIARAAAIAVSEQAELVIVCPFTPIIMREEAKQGMSTMGEYLFDQIPGELAATQALEEAVEVATRIGATIRAAELIDGPAAAALKEAVINHEADLLVIGAIRGRSFLEYFLGTVAEDVVQNVPSDILIVRPPGDEPVTSRPEDVTPAA